MFRPEILLVIILGIASVGVYSFETNTFDLYLALMFGVLGYVFRKLDIPKAPLIFGLILGEKIEQSFRQAMTISGGDPDRVPAEPAGGGPARARRRDGALLILGQAQIRGHARPGGRGPAPAAEAPAFDRSEGFAPAGRIVARLVAKTAIRRGQILATLLDESGNNV